MCKPHQRYDLREASRPNRWMDLESNMTLVLGTNKNSNTSACQCAVYDLTISFGMAAWTPRIT